jgi:uncharacterized phage protein (TIGR02218 family)
LFDEREASAAEGSPVELFRFLRGGQAWAYTSADAEMTHGGHTYRPVPIYRGAIERGEESGSGNVSVQMDSRLSLPRTLMLGMPPTPLWLTIFRGHRDDPEMRVIFNGEVSSFGVRDGEAALQCVGVRNSMQQSVPRYLYQRTCNRVLYGPGCGVNPDDHRAAGVISATEGLRIWVNWSQPHPGWSAPEEERRETQWATGGWVQIPDTDIRAYVTQHLEGGVIDLMQRPDDLVVGASIHVYAGCNRKREHCLVKFGNEKRFLGFPYIPTRNPIEGY